MGLSQQLWEWYAILWQSGGVSARGPWAAGEQQGRGSGDRGGGVQAPAPRWA